MKKNKLLFLILELCILTFACCYFYFSHLSEKPESSPSVYRTEKEWIEKPMTRNGQILLRLADNQRADHPTSIACDYFADLVAERTEGRIQIIPYHASKLGDEKSTLSQLHYTNLDCLADGLQSRTDRTGNALYLQRFPTYVASSRQRAGRLFSTES